MVEIALSSTESAAVQAALRRYVSDLRMEIVDTDNPEYKRALRSEREALEGALAKLDAGQAGEAEATQSAELRVVRLWWSATSSRLEA